MISAAHGLGRKGRRGHELLETDCAGTLPTQYRYFPLSYTPYAIADLVKVLKLRFEVY
jgi:hypothetical protein